MADYEVNKMVALNPKYEGKKVRVTDNDGKIFEGHVFAYIYPEDNAPNEIGEIDIENCPQAPGKLIGFTEEGIKSIEILS